MFRQLHFLISAVVLLDLNNFGVSAFGGSFSLPHSPPPPPDPPQCECGYACAVGTMDCSPALGGIVTTLAGSGVPSSNDGTGTAATFNNPNGMFIPADGAILYVGDQAGNRIRAIEIATGAVSTLAGSGANGFADGTGAAASFNGPTGICGPADGAVLYVIDANNHRIRAVDTATGTVTTFAGSSGAGAFADGVGTAASFNSPRSCAVTADGAIMYVSDQINQRIRAVDTATGAVTTLAGSGTPAFADGVGTAASFNAPEGVCVTADGATVYVGDKSNLRVRAIDTATGVVTTLAGSGTAGFADGTGAAASFRYLMGVAVTSDGSTVFVADRSNNAVRAVDTATGAVTTTAGSGTAAFADGTGAAAAFNYVADVIISPDGSVVYVADYSNNRIRAIV